MAELSQNINVRTTFQVKRKVMEESEKKEMKMSEYILYALESFWEDSSAANTSFLEQELNDTKAQLLEAQATVTTLTAKNKELEEVISEMPKGAWQEANETSKMLTEEFVRDECERAVREYQRQQLGEMTKNENLHIQNLASRLKLYETPLLKSLYEIVKHNPAVKDLPDVVSILTQNYYQQFINQVHE